MTNPRIIQPPAANKVSCGREKIIAEQMSIPRIGTSGTKGVVNGRTASGFFLRITQTPAHTITKANRVPMLVKSPATLPGTNAANRPTNTNKIMLDL